MAELRKPVELNAPVVAAFVELFTNRLPAAIVTVNEQESATGVSIADPAQILPYITTIGQLKAGLPAVCIQDMPSSFEDDLQFSLNAKHQLAICSVLQNADHGILAQQLRMYTKAVILAIQHDREAAKAGYLASEPAQVLYTRFVGTEPGPLLGDRDPNAPGETPATFESWTWLFVECLRTEI